MSLRLVEQSHRDRLASALVFLSTILGPPAVTAVPTILRLGAGSP